MTSSFMSSEAGQSTSEPFLNKTNHHQLYGREDEEIALQQACLQCNVTSRIVWVKGHSGTGKSTLVQYAFRDEDYLFIGKFEFLRSAVPYAALTNILTNLCERLALDRTSVDMNPDDVMVLSNLIPDIRNVIKCDNERNVLSHNPEWGLERLKQSLRSFIKAVCKVLTSPLILFLDDLQWANADTLSLVQDLLMDSTILGLLFVGSFRDNELADNDKLVRCITEISNSRLDCISEVCLENLDHVSCKQLVADELCVDVSAVESFATLLYKKTKGNCFYTKQMLRHILEKNLLILSSEDDHWAWNIEEILDELDKMDDIADLMAMKLQALPDATKNALILAACLTGTTVDILLLNSIYPILNSSVISAVELREKLEPAIDSKFIFMEADENHFRFSHDRVTSAAYELIPGETMRKSLHRKIGRVLYEMTFSQEKSSKLFVLAVDQLNRGSDLIEGDREKTELARLNLVVAKRVIKTGAFKMAVFFLETGIEILGCGRWENQYELSLQLSNLFAFALYSIGRVETSVSTVTDIYEHTKLPEERYEAQFIHLEALVSMDRLNTCLSVGLHILKDLGHPKLKRKPGLIHILPGLSRVKKLLKGKSDDELVNLPECADQRLVVITRHLAFLSSVAYYADEMVLMPLFTIRSMLITLQRGVTENSSVAFGQYANMCAVLGNFAEAHRFGKLALQMMERFGENPRTTLAVHGTVMHLQRPLHESVSTTLRTYMIAFAEGDMILAATAMLLHCFSRFSAGLPLGSLVEDAIAFSKQLTQYKQNNHNKTLMTFLRAMTELTGRTEELSNLMGSAFDDKKFEAYARNGEIANMQLLSFWMFGMESRYYLGDIDSALDFAEKGWRAKGRRGAFSYSPGKYMFGALIALHAWKNNSKRRHWRLFRMLHMNLKTWVQRGNKNTVHMVALLDAELLVVRQADHLVIRNAFKKAIRLANRCGFLQHAALSNERFLLYYLAHNEVEWAKYHLVNSRNLFEDWNATAKVQQLEKEYSSLFKLEGSKESHELRISSTSLTGRSRASVIAQVEARAQMKDLEQEGMTRSSITF